MNKKNYIKNKLILSLLLFLAFGSISIPSGSPAAQPLDPTVLYNHIEVQITQARDAEPAQQQEHDRRMAAIEARIAATPSEAERSDLIRQQTAIIEGNNGRLANGNTTLQTRLAALNMMNNNETARIAADAKRNAAVQTTKMWIDTIKSPKTIGLVCFTAFGIFSAWHITTLLKKWISIPKLSQKSSLQSWGAYFKRFFIQDKESVFTLNDVILNEPLKKRVLSLTEAIKHTKQSAKPLYRHFLFYGPPGTGKTMLALAMAHEIGMRYIYFSAAKLLQYTESEGLQQLSDLFETAKSYGLMIIIDEAELLFAKRPNLSHVISEIQQKKITLLEQILTYTGTESPYYMTIAISNKPDEFDKASLSRFGEQIYFPLPALEERKQLLNQYIEKYLITSTQNQPDTRSFLQSICTPTPQNTVIHIEKNLLSSETLEDVAHKLEGFAGREIADFVQAVQGRTYASLTKTVTTTLLYETLAEKVAQKEAEKNNFMHVDE